MIEAQCRGQVRPGRYARTVLHGDRLVVDGKDAAAGAEGIGQLLRYPGDLRHR